MNTRTRFATVALILSAAALAVPAFSVGANVGLPSGARCGDPTTEDPMRFDRTRSNLHLSEGLFFQRQDDGSVTIAKFQSDLRDAPPVVEQTIAPDEWATAVAAVSASTDSAAAFRAAEELHTKGVQVAGADQRPDQTDTEVESEFVDRVAAFLEARNVTTNPRGLAEEMMRELQAPAPRGPEPFSAAPTPEETKAAVAAFISDQRDPGDENDRTPSPTVETPSA